MLYAAPGVPAAPTRAAFIAGKKVGDAVRRNRAKRWMREAFRLQLPYIKQGWDVIWIARPSMDQAEFRRVQVAIAECLKRAHLYENTSAGAYPPLSEDH